MIYALPELFEHGFERCDLLLQDWTGIIGAGALVQLPALERRDATGL